MDQFKLQNLCYNSEFRANSNHQVRIRSRNILHIDISIPGRLILESKILVGVPL